MKTNNWKRTLNIVISSMSSLLVAILLAINLVSPIPKVRAELTKEDVISENINFISATTNIRQIIGFKSTTQYTDDGTEYYDYIYNYQIENFNYYTATSAMPDATTDGATGKLETDPMVQQTNLFTDSSKVEIEIDKGDVTDSMSMYSMYDYASKDTAKNDFNRYYHYGYIPTDTQYFQDADGTLQDLFYNEVDDNAFVLLQNDDLLLDSSSQDDPVNVANFYVNMGSAIIDETDPHTALAGLRVSGLLYNSEGIHYLDLNNTLSTKVTLGNTVHDNYYWYQYFDLNSIRAKKTNDASSPIYTITNTQGKYVLSFEYLTYLSNGTGTAPAWKTYNYTFYLLDESTYAYYPALTEDAILGSISADEVSSYYYNFGTENYPEIEYYPNIYSIEIEREYDGKTTNIQSEFSTSNISFDDKVYHKALISYYDDAGELDQEITILSFNSSDTTTSRTIYYSYYLYLLNTSGTSITANSFDAYENYINNGTLSVLFKIVDTITIETFEATLGSADDSSLIYNLYTYKTYKNYVLKEFTGDNFSNWYSTLNTNNSNEKVIKEEYYIKSLHYQDAADTYEAKFYQLTDVVIPQFKASTDEATTLALIEDFATVDNELLSMISSDNQDYQCNKIAISSSDINKLLHLGTIQTNYYYSYNIEELGSYNITYYYLVGYYDTTNTGISYLSSKGSTITVKNYNVSYDPSGDEDIEVDKSEDINNLPISSANGYSMIDTVQVSQEDKKVYIGQNIETQGSTAVYCFAIDKSNYGVHQPIQAYMSGNFTFNPASQILYVVASTEKTISYEPVTFKPALYRYNPITDNFDVVIEWINQLDDTNVYAYDVNTDLGIYTQVCYRGISYNSLTINFTKLGYTTYSNDIDVDTDKLAWNYDLDINIRERKLVVDADKNISIFKISKTKLDGDGNNIMCYTHTYDSTERDSTKLSFNTQYYHNYIVALNTDNEPCLYRLKAGGNGFEDIVNFVDHTSGTVTDIISQDTGEIVIITYTVVSNELSIVFKVCKTSKVTFSKENTAPSINTALDISRIEVDSVNKLINIDDYQMDIVILNLNDGSIAHNNHYATQGFNENIDYYHNSQVAYAVLGDSNGNPNLYRYELTGDTWTRIPLSLTDSGEQLHIDTFTRHISGSDVTYKFAIHYKYNTTYSRFDNLAFAKIANTITYTDASGEELSTSKGIEANSSIASSANFSRRYYSLENLKLAENTVYVVQDNQGYTFVYQGTSNNFYSQFDKLNKLYTMGKFNVEDYYVNTYRLNSTAVSETIEKTDPNGTEHENVVNYFNYTLDKSANFGTHDNTTSFNAVDYNKTFVFGGTEYTYEQLISMIYTTLPTKEQINADSNKPLIRFSINETEHVENVEKTGTRWVDNPADPDGPQIEETYTYYEDVYSYTYTTTYTIAGVNGSGYDNVYLIKHAGDDKYYVYVGYDGLNNIEFLPTDEIHLLSKGSHYEHSVIEYAFGGESGTASMNTHNSGIVYENIYNAIIAECGNSIADTIINIDELTSTNISYAYNLSDNYYLNYTPSNAGTKVALMLINTKTGASILTVSTSIVNLPYVMRDNAFVSFTTNGSMLQMKYYRTDTGDGIVCADTFDLAPNSTAAIIKNTNTYANSFIRYTYDSSKLNSLEMFIYDSYREVAGVGNEISTNKLIDYSKVSLSDEELTLPKYRIALIGIDKESNTISNSDIKTSFCNNYSIDPDNKIYYTVAKSMTGDLYLYKLVYNSTDSIYVWEYVGTKFGNVARGGTIDDTTNKFKIGYKFSNYAGDIVLEHLSFTAFDDTINDSSKYDAYFELYYTDNSLTLDVNDMMHCDTKYLSINTVAGTLIVKEKYYVPVIIASRENGVITTIETHYDSTGVYTIASTQKLYVVLNTTNGTDTTPSIFAINFDTADVNALEHMPISYIQEPDLDVDLTLKPTVEYYYIENDYVVIYKAGTTEKTVQLNIIDTDTSYSSYTSFEENKDFNPKLETQEPTISIGESVVEVLSTSPISFVLINKNDYTESQVFALSDGSFEFKSTTHILYTFRIDTAPDPTAPDPTTAPTIEVVNMYRYDYTSTDERFPFKFVTTLKASDTEIMAEIEEFTSYCDIDYYEDLYTIINYKLTSDFKLIINYAKLYPAFVNIGGYFTGANNENQKVTIIDVPYTYEVTNGIFSLIVRPDTVDKRVVILDATNRTAVYAMDYTHDGEEYTTYIEYSITLDTTGIYLNVKYVLGYMEVYEGIKESTSHVGGGSTNPEYGSITETVTYQKIHNPLPSDSLVAEFNSLIRYVGTDLSSTQDNLIKYYTSETTSPIESSINIDIFGLKNYYNAKDNTTDNNSAEMNFEDVNNDITYTSDVTHIYVEKSDNYSNNIYDNTHPISTDFLSEILGENQAKINADGKVTVSMNNVDTSEPFTLNNLIITNVTPTFWTYLCNFLYDSSNRISQSIIYKYDYDLVYDEWGGLKQLSYNNTEYSSYYLTKDSEINDDGLYQIIVKYTYDNYKYLDADSNVLDGRDVVFFQLFTFIVNNNTPTLTISVGNDDDGYSLIGTSNYTNKNIMISWVATTVFQNYEYITITNTNFFGVTNFVATFNPSDMSVTTTSGNGSMVNAITTFTYDHSIKSYVVYIKNDAGSYNANGYYKVRLHYGVNQSSHSTYEFSIDTEQISGLTLYSANVDENGQYYTTDTLSTQIVNNPFTLTFNEKNSGAKISASYYKLTLNQTNDYQDLLNTIIDTTPYTAVTTDFLADGTLNNTNQNYPYNYKYTIDDVGDYISQQCYINPSKPTIYMFYLTDTAGNSCRYFVFYDTTTPKYRISPELEIDYNIINDTTGITWGDYKAIKIKTPVGFNVDLTNYTTNSYSDLSQYTILQSILMYINSNTARFDGTLVKVIDGEYYFLVPLGDKTITNETNNVTYTIQGGIVDTSSFYIFTSTPTEIYVDPVTGEIILDTTGLIEDDDYKTVTPTVRSVGPAGGNFIIVNYTYLSVEHTLYGAYGEHKFYFTINDRIGNNLTNYVWMNFDQTQAFAWASFTTAASLDNLNYITPNNIYSAAQLYFSAIDSTPSNNIPEFKVAYSYYDFEYKNNDLYSNYTLTNASVTTKDVVEENRRTVTYLNLEYTRNNNNTDKLNYSIEIKYTDKYGNSYDIATTSYPFSLTSTSGSDDLYAESLAKPPANDDPDRIYSNMINPVYNSTTGTSMTAEGLYIFKREYVDITDASVLDNDTIIKYYVYYVDRTGIINLSASLDSSSILSNMINFTLGSGQGASYSTEVSSVNISTNTTNMSTSKNSNTVELSNNLFTANKVPIQLNIPVDKYNFGKLYNTLINSSYYTNLNSDARTTLLNTVYNQNIINKNFTLNVDYSLGNTKLDTYTTYQGGNYTLVISDNAGYDYTDAYGNLMTNYLSNKSTISYTISHNVPTASAYGKYYGQYDYIDKDKPDEFTLLSNYFANGNLQELGLDSRGEVRESTLSGTGSEIKLYNTNNESLIFIFSITNDKFKAQIDPNNLIVYANNSNIFQVSGGVVVNGNSNAYISSVIKGVTYYAIIVYDNTLDGTKFENRRLLQTANNTDNANYRLVLHYVGDSRYYVGNSSTDTSSYYYSATYDISVDRSSPTYNLTKLMALDRYFNDTASSVDTITTSNYTTMYDTYSQNFIYEIVNENDGSITNVNELETYFFAIDYRLNTGFTFESINSNDSSNNIYFRYLGDTFPKNYAQTITPDKYTIYYDTTYKPANPRFVLSSTVPAVGGNTLDTEKYYSLSYNGMYNGVQSENSISMYNLTASSIGYDPIMYAGGYYEIIEVDEANNYQVYGIYLPKYTDTNITYVYNPTESTEYTGRATAYNNPQIIVSGFNLRFTSYNNDDNYLKAKVTFSDKSYSVYFDPYTRSITTKDGDDTLQTHYSYTIGVLDSPLTSFRNTINTILTDYHEELLNRGTEYTVYGYTVSISIVDRIGVALQNTLLDYVFTYVVSGSVLDPEFTEDPDQRLLYVNIPKQTGSTFIKRVEVYKFDSSWLTVGTDYNGTIIDQSSVVLMNGFRFRFSTGMYKFVTTDNFDRRTTYFYQYGLSDSHTGGSLGFTTPTSTYETDDYTYTSGTFTFSYDNSMYSLYIRYLAEGSNDNQIIEIFNGDRDDLTSASVINALAQYNITVSIMDKNTTLTFKNNPLTYSRFIIKTVFANLESSYIWDSEKTNADIIAYTHKIALYTYIPNVIVKNLSGSTLNTSSQLSLTEDFTVNISWLDVDTNFKYNFNNQIFIERNYTTDGVIYEESYYVSTGYTISEPGNYTAYVINSIGQKSASIHFTRSKGEILLYAVYTISGDSDEETKLIESNVTNTYADTDKVNYNFYTLNTYLNYKDENGQYIINQTLDNIDFDSFLGIPESVEELNFIPNEDARFYVDVRTNSNMGILAKIVNIDYISANYDTVFIPYVTYKIYTISDDGLTEFIYRYVTIYFLDVATTEISNVEIYKKNNDVVESRPMYDNSSTTHTIRDTSDELVLYFDAYHLLPGNLNYVEYYLNGELIDTLKATSTTQTRLTTTISDVGIHRFVIKDLAGHTHSFYSSYTTLYIYLINDIIYDVNGENPINYQVFNDKVTLSISDTVIGIGQIYDATNVGIKVLKNGAVYEHEYANKTLEFTEPGHYSVTLDILTTVSNAAYSEIDRVISTTYNFTILNSNVAQRSFSIPKSYNFTVEKFMKDNLDYTDTLDTLDSLWLSGATTGAGVYEITIKTYLTSLRDYKSFTFTVWVSEENPSILGSIKYGETTTSPIELYYNLGLIYTQIGEGYIAINNKKVAEINAESLNEVETYTLTEDLEYYVQIFNADGQLISSYKFIKKAPLNSTAQLIIFLAIGAVVVLVIVFIMLRRKAKIR